MGHLNNLSQILVFNSSSVKYKYLLIIGYYDEEFWKFWTKKSYYVFIRPIFGERPKQSYESEKSSDMWVLSLVCI